MCLNLNNNKTRREREKRIGVSFGRDTENRVKFPFGHQIGRGVM